MIFFNVLVNQIIQQYFLNSRCIIVVTDEFNTFEHKNEIPMLNIRMHQNNLDTGVLFNYFGCQEIIIKTDKPVSTFKTFEHDIRHSMDRFNDRKYIIIPGVNLKENISKIFETAEIYFVANIIILNQTLNGSVNIFTHQYVGDKDNNKEILLDQWFIENTTFLHNNTLFPDKLYQQFGRPLKMATFQYEPYSIIAGSKLYGSEMLTVVEFAKKYNMTPIPVINEKDYWGVIYPNWTGTGLFINIATDKADVGFSALYSWDVEYSFLDLSKTIVRAGVTCLVPAPKVAAGWFTPLFSYSRNMWILFFLMYLYTLAAGFTINIIYSRFNLNTRYPKINKTKESLLSIISKSTFNISKSFVLQSLRRQDMPFGMGSRFFYIILFIFSLIFATSYGSGLASIMTIPRYEHLINTLEDFLDSGLHWAGTQEVWIKSIDEVKDWRFETLVNRFVSLSEAALREKSIKGGYAFVLERLPNENYAIGPYIKEDVINSLHLMRKDFYWGNCVVWMKKSSVLLRMLDLFILRVVEAGLVGYWQNQAVVLYMDPLVQKAVKYLHNERTTTRLKWIHVEGAFALLGIGYCISILAVALYMDPLVQKAVKYSHYERTTTRLKWMHVECAFALLGIGYCLSVVLFLLQLHFKFNLKQLHYEE